MLVYCNAILAPSLQAWGIDGKLPTSGKAMICLVAKAKPAADFDDYFVPDLEMLRNDGDCHGGILMATRCFLTVGSTR